MGYTVIHVSGQAIWAALVAQYQPSTVASAAAHEDLFLSARQGQRSVDEFYVLLQVVAAELAASSGVPVAPHRLRYQLVRGLTPALQHAADSAATMPRIEDLL
jgi:hypothetical protein